MCVSLEGPPPSKLVLSTAAASKLPQYRSAFNRGARRVSSWYSQPLWMKGGKCYFCCPYWGCSYYHEGLKAKAEAGRLVCQEEKGGRGLVNKLWLPPSTHTLVLFPCASLSFTRLALFTTLLTLSGNRVRMMKMLRESFLGSKGVKKGKIGFSNSWFPSVSKLCMSNWLIHSKYLLIIKLIKPAVGFFVF